MILLVTGHERQVCVSKVRRKDMAVMCEAAGMGRPSKRERGLMRRRRTKTFRTSEEKEEQSQGNSPEGCQGGTNSKMGEG